MADEYTSLEHLSFLIVDDFSNFSSALRTMIMSFGAPDIDIAVNGEAATEALQEKKYDIVLCDFNLGEGKNGNDVLEEAKASQLLKSASIFIMITAENSNEMVRGALEYQPDDYLTKPITKEVLMSRLVRLLNRNHVFNAVYRLRDHGQLDKAIDKLPEIIAKYPRTKRYAQRLWADMLMQNEQFQEASILYQEVLREKALPWATLGLGKAYFYQEDMERAGRFFRSLLDQDKGYVQAWDWLSRCQEKQGEFEAARDSLLEAVSISPINVKRQNALGDLSLKIGDEDRAERAFSRAVKIGKHSVYRTPDSYMKMADLLIKKLDGAEGLNAKRAENKALTAMEEVRQLYRGEDQVVLKSRFAESQVHTAQGRPGEAEKSILRAYDICKNDTEGMLSGELKERLITELENLNRGDMVNKIVAAMQEEDSGYNNQAISYYEKGDLDGALEILKQAIKDKPRSYSICLNTAQVAMHYMVKNEITEANMALARGALERASSIAEDDHRYQNYLTLAQRFEKLVRRQESNA